MGSDPTRKDSLTQSHLERGLSLTLKQNPNQRKNRGSQVRAKATPVSRVAPLRTWAQLASEFWKITVYFWMFIVAK